MTLEGGNDRFSSLCKNKVKIGHNNDNERASILGLFGEYFGNGGMPKERVFWGFSHPMGP
jgi:hypothetical protein